MEIQLQHSPLRKTKQAEGAQVVNTWTPAITFAGTDGNITHSIQQGIYVRNVNVVWLAFELTLSSKGTVTGIFPKLATITGLPYAAALGGSANISALNLGLIFWADMTTSLVNMTGNITILGNVIQLVGLTAAATDFTFLTHSDFSDTTTLRGQFSYFV